MAELAARRHGIVTRAQLLALGCSDNAIAYRVRCGRLFCVHPGVYAVGHPPVAILQHACAAVLACGPHAALSHGSALALWGLVRWPARLEVLVTRGHPRPRHITVHRCHTLARRDLTTQRAIRVTTPARALLESAPRLTDRQLIRAVNDARHARLISSDALADVVQRYCAHAGARRLAPFTDPAAPLTESPFEDRFLALCRTYALPIPRFGAYVRGYRVDALFVSEKLIVECDGWEFHRDRHAFVTDRERDVTTLAAGYATVRITWERPDDAEAARLHTILEQRRR